MIIWSSAAGGGRDNPRRPIYAAAAQAFICVCLLCSCAREDSDPVIPPVAAMPAATIATAEAGTSAKIATATATEGAAFTEITSVATGEATAADMSDLARGKAEASTGATTAEVMADKAAEASAGGATGATEDGVTNATAGTTTNVPASTTTNANATATTEVTASTTADVTAGTAADVTVITTTTTAAATEAITAAVPTSPAMPPVTARPTATIATAEPGASAKIATATATANAQDSVGIATGGAGQTAAAPDRLTAATAVYDAMGSAATMPEMFAVSGELISDYYGADASDYIDAVFMMCADSLKADEFVILLAADKDAADRLEDMLGRRLQTKADEARSYSPEQYAIIEKCSVSRDGLWVAMIVSPDAEAFRAAYAAAIGQ